jgi:hypothetical protein
MTTTFCEPGLEVLRLMVAVSPKGYRYRVELAAEHVLSSEDGVHSFAGFADSWILEESVRVPVTYERNKVIIRAWVGRIGKNAISDPNCRYFEPDISFRALCPCCQIIPIALIHNGRILRGLSLR